MVKKKDTTQLTFLAPDEAPEPPPMRPGDGFLSESFDRAVYIERMSFQLMTLSYEELYELATMTNTTLRKRGITAEVRTMFECFHEAESKALTTF